MSQRTEIKEGMRAILVDWLIQVHNRFRLLQETLYITISIVDRFLSVSGKTYVNLRQRRVYIQIRQGHSCSYWVEL